MEGMKLEDFVGNQPIVHLMRNGHLPPAGLFTGLDGIGKKTLALRLAALANCKDSSGQDLCGKCPSCLKAAAGHHPDHGQHDQDHAQLDGQPHQPVQPIAPRPQRDCHQDCPEDQQKHMRPRQGRAQQQQQRRRPEQRAVGQRPVDPRARGELGPCGRGLARV